MLTLSYAPDYTVAPSGLFYSRHLQTRPLRAFERRGVLVVQVQVPDAAKASGRRPRFLPVARTVLSMFKGSPWRRYTLLKADDPQKPLADPKAWAVDYLDGDVSNCSLANLRWRQRWLLVDGKEPAWSSTPRTAKLTAGQAHCIRANVLGKTVRGLARAFGISSRMVRFIRDGVSWVKRVGVWMMRSITHDLGLGLMHALESANVHVLKTRRYLYNRRAGPEKSKAFGRFCAVARSLAEDRIDPVEYAHWCCRMHTHWPDGRPKDYVLGSAPPVNVVTSMKSYTKFLEHRATSHYRAPFLDADFVSEQIQAGAAQLRYLAGTRPPAEVLSESWMALPAAYLAALPAFTTLRMDGNIMNAASAPALLAAVDSFQTQFAAEGTHAKYSAFAETELPIGISSTTPFLGLPHSKAPDRMPPL